MQKILIVDDHPLYREGMVSALRQSLGGIEISGANSAEEGLRSLDTSPDTDLVLIDVRLPGMDGFEALGLYANRHPAVSRVLISGQDEPHLARRALGAGASGFIHKSMSVQAVVAAIRRVLAGDVFVPTDDGEVPEGAPGREEPDSGITLRQLEVLRLLEQGLTNKEIARALDITERTAKAHVAAIFEAFGAENRTQAVVTGQRRGLLPAGETRK